MKNKKNIIAISSVVIVVISALLIIVSWKINRKLDMPNLIGEDKDYVIAKLADTGIKYDTIFDYSYDYDENIVYDQSVQGGEKIKKNIEVKVYISRGIKKKLPELIGKNINDSRPELTNIKYTLIEEYNEEYDRNIIFKTVPEAGKDVVKTDDVKIYVSKGGKTTVPNIIGMSLDEAEKTLNFKGINVGKVTYNNVVGKAGDVVESYSPDSVGYDEKVDIVITKECINIPDLSGKTVDEAKKILEEQGLEYDIVYTYNDVTNVQCNKVSSNISVISQNISGMVEKDDVPKVEVKVQMPAIEIDSVDFDIDSVGGLELKMSFTNKSGKQIAYITYTVNCYDTMGYPAYCEVYDRSYASLNYTGPLNGWSSSGWITRYPVIYNNAFGAIQPESATITFTDGTKQYLSYDGRYWYNSRYYGGDLHDD